MPSALWSEDATVKKKKQERQDQKNTSFKGKVRKEGSGRDSADADQGQRPRITR